MPTEENTNIELFISDGTKMKSLGGVTSLDASVDLPSYKTLYYSIPYAIPIRKHKKKRINKKWLKQYGVKVGIISFCVKSIERDMDVICELDGGHILLNWIVVIIKAFCSMIMQISMDCVCRYKETNVSNGFGGKMWVR